MLYHVFCIKNPGQKFHSSSYDSLYNVSATTRLLSRMTHSVGPIDVIRALKVKRVTFLPESAAVYWKEHKLKLVFFSRHLGRVSALLEVCPRLDPLSPNLCANLKREGGNREGLLLA